MNVAGIIIEYDPLHMGHVYLMEEVRRQLGADTAIIGVMSGNFVQRGEFAVVRKAARAKAAVESGMDLVLELPLPWAVASAERFADGGVQTLMATGLVTHLAFGSEDGTVEPLQRLATVLLSAQMQESLQQELSQGSSFAAARQRAVERLLSAEEAALLAHPNNILGVEYCKALLCRKAAIQPWTVRRKGTAYHGTDLTEELPSATLVRKLLREGDRDRALSLMAPAMKVAYLSEEAVGRAPVFADTCERAILARLRSMTLADFTVLDEGNEGLYHRLYDASRTAVSVEQVLEAAKTKRYAYTRLQRMVLWAWLGIRPDEFPEEVPYLRVLAANETGRQLLARMRKTAAIPVLTKSGQVRQMGEQAQALFAMETRAADLYALAYPDLSAAVGGSAWREGPVLV